MAMLRDRSRCSGFTRRLHMFMLSRILISFVTLVTLIGSNIADWNSTHIFSELWSPHAHFHGAWFVIAMSLLSLLCLWLVWSPASQVDRSRIAALIQGCIWLAFFPAMLVPDTALADPGKQFVPIAGLDLNLVGAVGHIVLLAIALALLQPRARA
jgi:cbb3-type cytochrome oxidase subunit 3